MALVIEKKGLHDKGPKSVGKVFIEAGSDATAFTTFVAGFIAWAPHGINALSMWLRDSVKCIVDVVEGFG